MSKVKSYIKNKQLYFIFISVIVLSFSSCIPTSKIVYLEPESKSQYPVNSTSPQFNYEIQAGDRFYIQITDPLANISLGGIDPNTSESQRVNLIQQSPSVHDYVVGTDGYIDYPMIGKIKAAGLNIHQLREEIIRSCEEIINNPSVKLFMTNYNVTIMGEVYSPGFYQLITDQPTLFDAIGQARDMTDFADRKQIKIIRKVEGKVSINQVDVTDPDFIKSQFYYIKPNDVIHVVPLRVKKYSSNNALPLVLSVITTIITVISITSR